MATKVNIETVRRSALARLSGGLLRGCDELDEVSVGDVCTALGWPDGATPIPGPAAEVDGVADGCGVDAVGVLPGEDGGVDGGGVDEPPLGLPPPPSRPVRTVVRLLVVCPTVVVTAFVVLPSSAVVLFTVASIPPIVPSRACVRLPSRPPNPPPPDVVRVFAAADDVGVVGLGVLADAVPARPNIIAAAAPKAAKAAMRRRARRRRRMTTTPSHPA